MGLHNLFKPREPEPLPTPAVQQDAGESTTRQENVERLQTNTRNKRTKNSLKIKASGTNVGGSGGLNA